MSSARHQGVSVETAPEVVEALSSEDSNAGAGSMSQHHHAASPLGGGKIRIRVVPRPLLGCVLTRISRRIQR
eukprot:5483753-Pyramimonas_sp.AAC.1